MDITKDNAPKIKRLVEKVDAICVLYKDILKDTYNLDYNSLTEKSKTLKQDLDTWIKTSGLQELDLRENMTYYLLDENSDEFFKVWEINKTKATCSWISIYIGGDHYISRGITENGSLKYFVDMILEKKLTSIPEKEWNEVNEAYNNLIKQKRGT